MPIALLVLALLVFVESILLVRASRRLLQFDDLFQDLVAVLEEYSADLTKMVSADLDGVMVDHPEVIAFHQRNMRARRAVQSSLESIVASVSTSRRTRKKQSLPRPDVG